MAGCEDTTWGRLEGLGSLSLGGEFCLDLERGGEREDAVLILGFCHPSFEIY
jgi:hypothetical protein